MLIHHIILLTLSWQWVLANENEKRPSTNIIDQMATGSDKESVFSKNLENPSTIDAPNDNPTTTPSAVKSATIHYENSNGFVPISSIDGIDYETSEIPEIATTMIDETDEKSRDSYHREAILIEEDPAYSTEARMFLNLARPSADRRSFDAQDGQSEFEILKVTNETPAIANYHEFYENIQSTLNRNRGGTQTRNEETTGRTTSPNKRTKERIKKIEKYLTNFHETENPDPYKQRESKQKDIFEPERVSANFQQSASSMYDIYGQNPLRQRASMSRGNYDDGLTSRQKYPSVTAKNRHSKPVVVVEPSDYKLDMKYGGHHVVAKVISNDNHKIHKNRKEIPEVVSPNYDAESRVNGEDRYGQSYERSELIDDYSDEDYPEITEKPRRIQKTRRRPHSVEHSRRLPKEHRGVEQEIDDSRKNNSPTRSKLQRPRSRPNYWKDEDRDNSEENSDEQTNVRASSTKNSDNLKEINRGKGAATSWSQIGPNIEVSHSDGFEIGQIGKPKILVPVNLNLLPLTNFDRSTALGNSQGFDLTNVPNFVTAAPMLSSPSPVLSTSQPVGNANTVNNDKNLQASLNNNYGLSTALPDVIVGQNSFQNPLQTVILPQMNVNNKFPPSIRSPYSASTIGPMFTVAHNHLNSNIQNIVPTMTSVPLQHFPTTPSPRTGNFHHMTVNPISPIPQLLLPQPTIHTFPLLQTPYNVPSNYNILVNPNGLHGQNLIQNGVVNAPSVTPENSASTAPRLNNSAEARTRENAVSNVGNGQFVTSASFSVGNVQQQEQSNVNGNKYYSPTNPQNPVNNNNHYYNHNNQQIVRPQQENIYQIYRDEQNSPGKGIKTYVQTAQVVPAIIHHGNGIPMNFNNQNYLGGQLQEQPSILSPTIVAQRPRDQNQQILKAANDIFENTWKQLQQLQTNEEAARRLPYQHVYRVNDNLGSTSNANVNAANSLPAVNSVKAQLPILSTQNVEIVNPNIKPSPIDFTLLNHYDGMNYPGTILTTPIPIFGTTGNFLAPRPAVATSSNVNLHNYVDQLTQLGAQANQPNKIEPRPALRNHDNQRNVFNPINFVPSVDLMKSQTMLNSKHTEPLPNQLNLVPVIPGGNFFKNTYGAHTELVEKPRLSTDLEKYAAEMFKESLKTIYNTHKWNNDRRLRGNYSSAELNDLAKLKSDLQRFKASLPDTKYGNNDLLEAHHSETNVRTAEPSSGRTTKKPELTIAEIEQLFKSDFKLNLPSESTSHAHQKNRPGQGSTRTGSSNDHSNEYRNIKHLTDYLTPPKLNSFLSKSPFVDSAKTAKKRPGSTSSRYNSSNGKLRSVPRPGSLVSRPASSLDASASNHVESGSHADGYHRYEKHQKRPGHHSRDNNDNYDGNRHSSEQTDYRSYPTFTTGSSTDNDLFKTSSSEQYSKTDYYDINHPRMHNLLGLLMKNKQLPKGSSQSFFRDEDDLRQYFDNEKRRIHTEFYDEHSRNFQKKSDTPINMEPPAPPAQKRYYTRGAA